MERFTFTGLTKEKFNDSLKKMKTVKINPFMGKIEIPNAFRLVSNGLTQKGDQVSQDAVFNLFTPVRVGGVPLTRYFAVIRPIAGRRIKVWGKVRKAFLPKRKKIHARSKRRTTKKTHKR